MTPLDHCPLLWQNLSGETFHLYTRMSFDKKLYCYSYNIYYRTQTLCKTTFPTALTSSAAAHFNLYLFIMYSQLYVEFSRIKLSH